MKIGLVLEGGGGKGSYQIGAIQALYEKGYSFDVVSGTSIGALNAALLTMGSLEEAKSLWLNIQHEFGPILDAQSDNIDDEVFTRLTYAFENPDKIKELADLKGVIADNPLYKILEQYVTDSNIKSMSQELYTCSVPAIDNPHAKYFKINDFDYKTAIDIIISSTALPSLFDGIKINDTIYFDGGLYDVAPIKPVYDTGCDVIFVICLHQDANIDISKYPNSKIIPIIPSKPLGGFNDGTMDYSSVGAKWRIELGYNDTLKRVED